MGSRDCRSISELSTPYLVAPFLPGMRAILINQKCSLLESLP